EDFGDRVERVIADGQDVGASGKGGIAVADIEGGQVRAGDIEGDGLIGEAAGKQGYVVIVVGDAGWAPVVGLAPVAGERQRRGRPGAVGGEDGRLGAGHEGDG